MGPLDRLRKVAESTLKKELAIVSSEANMHVATNLISSAVSSQEFSSLEDLGYLLKILIEQVCSVNETFNQVAKSKQNILTSTYLVCDLYEKTNLTDFVSLKKIIPALQILEQNSYDELIPDINDVLTKLLCEDIPHNPSAEAKAKLMSIIGRLIPVLSSCFGEYVNIKNQIVSALDAITKGVEYILNQSGGKAMGSSWVLTCVDVSVELYIASVKQQIKCINNSDITPAMMSEIKKIYSNNLGYLVLAIKYMNPLVEGAKSES